MTAMSSRRRVLPQLTAMAVAGALFASACSGDGPADEKSSRPKPSAPTSASVPDPAATEKILTDEATPVPLDTVDRPNLLMITVDDAALKDMPYMPHLQQLMADQGTTIENGVAPTPICVPSRASILTGQYSHNHGAVTINGEGGGFPAFRGEADDDTLPVWLQRAGYDTMFLGKYLNGYNEETSDYTPPGWSTWRPTLDPTTYNYSDPTLLIDGQPEQIHQYSTSLLRDQSEEMIRDRADSDKPWYMWVNYIAPHSGGPKEPDDPKGIKTPAREDRDRGTFSDLENSDTPDMFEKDSSDKTIVPATQKKWGTKGRAALKIARQQRIESLQSVDRALVSTFKTLRDTDQLDSTYIVFTSDNGFATGEHNISGKLFYFTDILHIPMFIRGPGIPRGLTTKAPVTNADWAPTLAGLAGVAPGKDVDGVDVLPWLDSDATRRVIPIEGYPVQGGLKSLYRGVTVGNWTYVRGKSREELYDRNVDDYQLVNVRNDPRFKTYLKQMRNLTRSASTCAAATCPTEFMR